MGSASMVIQNHNLDKIEGNLTSIDFPPEDFQREATQDSQCPIFTNSSVIQSTSSPEKPIDENLNCAENNSIVAWQKSISLLYKQHKRNRTQNEWKIKKTDLIEGNYITSADEKHKKPNKPMDSTIDMRWKNLMPPYSLSKMPLSAGGNR